MTDAEVRRDYERIEDRAHKWSSGHKSRGASAFLYMERDGGMRYPVRSSGVATLCALQRAGRWVTSAAVTGERADCCDSSLDRVASSLGSLVNAGLVERADRTRSRKQDSTFGV